MKREKKKRMKDLKRLKEQKEKKIENCCFNCIGLKLRQEPNGM